MQEERILVLKEAGQYHGHIAARGFDAGSGLTAAV